MIIADDEAIARKSLELFVKKEFPEIHIINSVSDGIALVQEVERQLPDIAIVDINMPGLSGIDAIELLYNRGVKTRFVINTAYSEFDYVKKALELKVDGYLLKPEKYEESKKTIRKLCESISYAKAEQQIQSKMQSLFHVISPVLESEIMLTVFAGEPAMEDFTAYCEMYGISFYGGCMVSLIEENAEVLTNNHINKRSLRQAIHDILTISCNHLVMVTESSINVLVLLPKQMEAAEQKEWIWDVAQVLLSRLKAHCGISFMAGIGEIYGDFRKMSRSYKESLAALRQKNKLDVILYDMQVHHLPEEEPGASCYTLDRTLEEDFKTAASMKKSVYVEDAVSYIQEHYTEDISLDTVAEKIRISPFYLSRLMRQETGVTFVEYLTRVRIKEAIKLAINTNLSIKEIAERIGYLNVTYFCKVFKKRTGKTIGEYRRGN